MVHKLRITARLTHHAVAVGKYAILVSEVVSPASKRTDRELKRRSYAKAGIPFYLLVDRFVQPMTITLFSEPVKGDYAKSDVVPAGPGGGKLYVPDPADQ